MGTSHLHLVLSTHHECLKDIIALQAAKFVYRHESYPFFQNRLSSLYQKYRMVANLFHGFINPELLAISVQLSAKNRGLITPLLFFIMLMAAC